MQNDSLPKHNTIIQVINFPFKKNLNRNIIPIRIISFNRYSIYKVINMFGIMGGSVKC